MEALADKVHKQGEHIPQHSYILHNHPYINSSEYNLGRFLLEIFCNFNWRDKSQLIKKCLNLYM